MDLKEQIAECRRCAARPSAPRLIAGILAALATALTVLAFLTPHAGWIAGALAAWTVAGIALRATPHYANALRGLAEGRRESGTVVIRIEQWADGPTYRAEVADSRGGRWTFEFVPRSWSPKEGEFPAEIFHLDPVAWPVAATVADGVLLPRGKPVRSDRRSSADASGG
jgi:hypothetical protein